MSIRAMPWGDFVHVLAQVLPPGPGVYPLDQRARTVAAYLCRFGGAVLDAPIDGCLVLAIEDCEQAKALAVLGYQVKALASGPIRLPWEPELPSQSEATNTVQPDPFGALRAMGATEISVSFKV